MSAYVNYTQFLASLEKQWSSFQNGETENERKIFDANDLAKFNELIKLTLRAHLDFREILFASQELSTLKENIRIIISSLKLNDDLNYSVNIALNTEKWDSNLGQALLSGKLIGNASSKLYFLERKFQNESDDVIKARLDSLMHLLQNTNNNAYDTGQLVLNVYESYRKILLRDVNFQAKLSSETISTLLNNYLFILCHRKQFEHLHSAIKLFPIHRKLKYIRELLAKDNLSACEVHIAEGFLEDLLQKEFRKKKAQQNIKNYNVIISKISEVAANPLAKPHFNLERLVLSATTEVTSEYYYLVATHLRFKMPVANNLVLKLISIGLSHDITYMENIKYATSENQKERKEEFKKICRRMFLALVTLGCIIQNYTLRRLCFLAANVCEPDTRYCAELVKFLPESDEEKDESELDLISQDIRYQLETFQYDIRSNTNLPDSFDKSSNIIFESLEYFNHSIPLSEELKPLEYPGVEKYLKKQSIEDQQHISQTSDLDKCMREIDEFNINLAERFKKVKTLYTSAELPLRKPTPPSNDEILNKVKGVFLKSDYLKTINNFGLFAEMFSISLVELLTENYEPKWMSTYEKTDDNNQEILLFDFNSDDGGSDEIDVDVLYREGIIPVRQLISREYLCYDIENILLYAIMEKKMKLIAAEFEYINKNRNVETDTVQNQVHAALLYMFSKPHPEYTRLLRLTGTQMRFVNPIDFLMETYVMDVMPGKFKYTLKNKILKAKPESFENFDSGSNQTIESGETMTTVMAPTMSEDNSMTVKMQVASFINNKQSKIKKEKLAAAISLSSTESFNVSNEILNIFYNLKHELAQVTGKEVLIDLNKLSDMSSTNTINCINATQSNLIIKCTRTRNSHLDPRERSLDIPMPLLMNGKLTLVNEIRDSIEYDEFFDNPKIQTTFTYRLIGTLIVENLSHNVKFDLDISIDGVVSKLKIVFQGIKNSRPRKKLVKNPIAEATLPLSHPVAVTNAFVQQSNSNTMPQVSNSAVQPSQPTPPLPQPALINSHASPPSCLPSFGTIVTSHYVPVNNSYENAAHSLPLQYSLAPASVPSMTPVIANGNHTTASSSSSYSSVIPTAVAPVSHAPPPQCSSNGINYQLQSNQIAQSNQQFQPPNNFDLNTIKSENVQPHPISSPPTRVKVEILKVEDVSPMKLSFSNPCIVAKNDNTIQPSVVDANVKLEKQSVKNEADDELVDFEVAIQTSMVTSAVIPKKSALFPESIRSMQSTNKTIVSPPPLHYHTPKISEKSIVEIPKNEPVVFKRELLQSPTKEICAPASNPPPLDKKPPEAEAKAALAGSQNVPKTTAPVTKPQVFHKLTSNVIMKRTNLTEINGSKKNKEVLKVTDVIDLTDDNCDGNDSIKERPNQNLLDIQFVSCETQEPEFVALSPKMNNRVARKRNFQNVPTGPKIRALKRVPSEDRSRKCKIRVVDILKNINQKSLKKNTRIELKPYHSNNLSENHVFKGARRSDFLAQEVPTEEQPIEEYADNLFDATFTIVCQNSVSFLFNDADDYYFGDGIASCNKKSNTKNTANSVHNLKNTNTKFNNHINEIVNKFMQLNNENDDKICNKFMSEKNIENILRKDLLKTVYSDKNHLNFTKNLKNNKKFTRWTPKVSNCSSAYVDSDKKKAVDKSFFDDEKNHKSLLYQISHVLLNSLPGMHSMEFFRMPSPLRRTLQIEVVHLKDVKAAVSNESNDVNDSSSNEPSSMHHSDVNNGDSHSNATTIHIQKIGQTSISHETETRTLQTSFGSIIKNTYPPANSRVLSSEKDKLLKMKQDDGNLKKISIGETSLKANQNVKIIACTSQQSQQQHQQHDVTKSGNKNQTLINMLTQQVMVPTNSNRHYIITSAPKHPEMKQDTGASCTMTPSSQANSNNIRKTITSTVGQSQLVQILNSPPTNFTMKSLNVITSATNSSIPKPNQVVTVSSPSMTSVEGLKADLPNSVKQQGIVQFICKTDGKIIHLTPICNNNSTGGVAKKITYKVDTSGAKGPTILHHANQQIILNNQLRKDENPNILTIIQKQSDNTTPTMSSVDKKQGNKGSILGMSSNSQNNPASPICSRSIYEETYAKFIQTPSGSNTNSSDMGLLTISSSPISSSSTNPGAFIQKIGKTVIQSSNQILPKFNQAFGKSIFSSTTAVNEQVKSKVTTNRETITRSIVNSISPVTKITTKSEIKTSDGSLLNLIENESIEKPSSLPTTLQSALQGNNLLYARPIGNGKLIASNNNNVLLTALRNSGSNASNNVRIITTLSESMATSSNHRTIMTPVRISVPIQIPQLINSVRPQSPGGFRQQIVIATSPPTSASGMPAQSTATLIRPQTTIQNQTGSKLQSLLMGVQTSSPSTSSPSIAVATTTITNTFETEISKTSKMEQKSKKSVDNSTLEQLREFDMVLEQVLERSSATPNSVSSPPRPDSANCLSPRKPFNDSVRKIEIKSSSVSLASNSPNDSPTSSKSVSSNSAKTTTPKLQEDEHTAQRILNILANYKEQVRNSPDLNNKPAPRRRANPPTNPPAKRKKMTTSSSGSNMKSSKQFGSSSDVMTDNTMGSEEDSSCGVGSGVASTGSMNNSPRGDIDDHTDASMDNNFYMDDGKREIASSPQSNSSSSVATSPAHNKFSINRRLVLNETKTASNGSNINSTADSNSSKSLILSSSQSSTSNASSATRTSSIGESIERLSAQGSTATAVLMPGNYILPMNVLKSGQHLILSSNNGQKIIAVPASQLASSTSGTSIILQRYVNQINEGANKAVFTQRNESEDAKKVRMQQNVGVSIVSNNKAQQQAFYVKPIDKIKQEVKSEPVEPSSSSSSFVSDKTLITEIIQQQQQISHNHPQHNFMIKLNETSDPRNSSSIMFMRDTENKSFDLNEIKIKTEKIDFDGCIKEEVIDLNHENDILNSPMLTTKMEVDENTNSNQGSGDIESGGVSSQKLPHFPSILSSCLSKQVVVNSSIVANTVTNSKNTKGFLIDPTSKILMYNDRKQTNVVDKEIFNPKSFSEECADLGVDEPIASDLFPEADLLFDSGSPKFDQINAHDSAIQIKRELENGEVLLQMNYNHNITEPWLNCFDTEDELVDDSHGESGDDVKDSGLLKANHF